MLYWKYGCQLFSIFTTTFSLLNWTILISLMVYSIQILVSNIYYTIKHTSFVQWIYYFYVITHSSMWHNMTYTPIGMTITLIGQECGCVCAIFFSSTYLSLYVSTCLYISAFLKDIANSVEKLSLLAANLPKTGQKLELQFIGMIQLHEKTI